MLRNWNAYLFLAPGLLLFSVFTLFAMGFALYLTFHEWSIIQPEQPFVGLDNYRELMSDERFRRSVYNTVYFTGASVPLTMLVGLAVALLLNQPLRGRGLLRVMYFLPVVTPFVVVAIIWKWLYNGDFGLFNYYLLKTNLIDEPLLWLADKNLAMPSIILMSVWAGVGFSMVVYLAALQAVPEELYDAAKVDGGGAWVRLRHVTIPMLRPATLFLMVMGIIGSFQIFTQIFIMTQGGPVDRTTTMMFYIYEAAFKFYRMGYASTLAYALFAMLFIFTLIQLRLYRRAYE
ncbi:carbohydrate ABC transporter permease [Phytoactinopolyspora halotolerans]|uniref:Sugar ABC transporter permease n=1 Tax=Phytoactinopolyspora halotolerans TaxID=1981512 RepID=A0A6L9S460_9ACTN|nr:sugar ABC transporter permease [Phytoactinopolyspora halotolerans]NED99433.1 sugar ABC transporter permease [Phytoactinopolyspora halotolerans]